MFGLLIELAVNLRFLSSILLCCCRLFFFLLLAAALLLAITILLRSLLALLLPWSDRSDWLNKRQHETMLLLGEKSLTDVVLESRAI